MTRPVTGSKAEEGEHRTALQLDQLAQLRVLLQRLLAGDGLRADG